MDNNEWEKQLSTGDNDESLITLWLDNASHNNKIPAKYNYLDFQIVAEVLEDNLKDFIRQLLSSQSAQHKEEIRNLLEDVAPNIDDELFIALRRKYLKE